MYKWKCHKCGKEKKWNGEGRKPDTTCVGKGVLRKSHTVVRMECREAPKK
jgi:hypothetical protein